MPNKQLYEKIAQELSKRITSGQLKPGELLPSEGDLCEEFGASRGPVRQAIATLRSEGLVSSGRGRRSMVLCAARPESFKSTLSSYSWMKEHDLNPTVKMLWMARRPAPQHVAEALNKKEDDPIIFVSRILLSEGKPAVLERQYSPLEVGMHVLAMDPEDHDIHEELIREGVDIDSCVLTFEVLQADDTMGQLLEVDEGTPLIGSRIMAADSSGNPVEYAEYLYPAARREYRLTVVNGERLPLHSNMQFGPRAQWSYDESGF
jgi:GntR family transcriptional regulator